MINPLTGIDTTLDNKVELKLPKDMPKVEGQPKPQDPGVFTVYTDGQTMRARFHKPGDFKVFLCDGQIYHPENFCDVVEAWRGR